MPLENINLSPVGADSEKLLLDRLASAYSEVKGVVVSKHPSKSQALIRRDVGGKFRLIAVVELTTMAVSKHIAEVI